MQGLWSTSSFSLVSESFDVIVNIFPGGLLEAAVVGNA